MYEMYTFSTVENACRDEGVRATERERDVRR